MAVPVIMTGIRLSAIYVIAWATLASYIGARRAWRLDFQRLKSVPTVSYYRWNNSSYPPFSHR